MLPLPQEGQAYFSADFRVQVLVSVARFMCAEASSGALHYDVVLQRSSRGYTGVTAARTAYGKVRALNTGASAGRTWRVPARSAGMGAPGDVDDVPARPNDTLGSMEVPHREAATEHSSCSGRDFASPLTFGTNAEWRAG